MLTASNSAASTRAGHLFGGMPKRRRKSARYAEDRIGALPDELLQHLLSFLRSRDVRTSVLAKRWGTLWTSVPTLRIHDPDPAGPEAEAHGSGTFIHELLRRRSPTPLHVCEIESGCMEELDSDDAEWVFHHVKPFIRYALSCQARELRVSVSSSAIDMALVSAHLTRLELCEIQFMGGCLDFSSCPALEVLKMQDCNIFEHIFSRSLRHLSINRGRVEVEDRTRISAPNLIDFKLTEFWGLTPLLDRMPSLVTASVALGEGCRDYCDRGDLSCNGYARDADCSVVLQGLSGATNLELTMSGSYMFIFRKDLKWRPMFSKLKTLLLDDWCVVNDFTGLVYFLRHSPILETLTLNLLCRYYDVYILQKKHVIETDESYHRREQPLLSKHLKVVKIICVIKEDVMVRRILKIFRTHGVSSEQINIE